MIKTGVGLAAVVIAITVAAPPVASGDIEFRSFSASAAIGPPADAFAAKVSFVTRTALGAQGEVRLTRLPGLPGIPGGDIVNAVGAGKVLGGFDAAYISGSDLNKTWGFVFNSGVPFGPTFDEFVGFLYGAGGLDRVQALLDRRNVIALPIVGSPEQLSGYFFEPMGDVRGHHGIGLSGLCEQPWTLRYLPPGQDVLSKACDDLVASGRVFHKNITFVQAVPGGGSLIDAVVAGTLQGFEFATPLDDLSQLFVGANNPGTVGLRFVHTPGWQQQFLITWMLINKPVWAALTDAQRTLIQTTAQNHVLASYAENLRQQGPALQQILEANKGKPDSTMVLARWPMADQTRLRAATIQVLNARATDPALPAADRADYVVFLEALRTYVRANDLYWDKRQVETSRRFDDWASASGLCWKATCDRD